MTEFAVPVWLTVEAESPQAAVDRVADALTSERFEWPESLHVLASCVGNAGEVEPDQITPRPMPEDRRDHWNGRGEAPQ